MRRFICDPHLRNVEDAVPCIPLHGAASGRTALHSNPHFRNIGDAVPCNAFPRRARRPDAPIFFLERQNAAPCIFIPAGRSPARCGLRMLLFIFQKSLHYVPFLRGCAIRIISIQSPSNGIGINIFHDLIVFALISHYPIVCAGMPNISAYLFINISFKRR